MPRSRQRPASDQEQRNAHALVRAAVLNGHLAPAADTACVGCGRSAAIYHHPHGYGPGRGLDVEPVCRSCHRRRTHAGVVAHPAKLTIEYYGEPEAALVLRMRHDALERGQPVREWVLDAIREKLERADRREAADDGGDRAGAPA